MRHSIHLGVLALLCVLMAACGTPGAPRPPSLELPQPVNDLAATRVGDKVTLTWTPPRQTTDNQNIRHPGPVRICRGVNVTAMLHCQPLTELPPAQASPGSTQPERRTYTDTLSPELQQQNATGLATYALESLNMRGRSAGLSNQVQVPVVPTLPPPASITADVRSDSIVITTSGVEPLRGSLPPGISFTFHLFRSGPAGSAIDLGAATWAVGSGPGGYRSDFVDRSFEWETTYFYHVAAITTASLPGKAPMQVMGEPSAAVKVYTKDTFPPAAPTGLQAVASGVGQQPFVDLTWAPNTEPDLAGYNLYRHEAGAAPVKINSELVKTPAYRDPAAASGHKYFYSVSAVDLRGNESGKSEETSEAVP